MMMMTMTMMPFETGCSVFSRSRSYSLTRMFTSTGIRRWNYFASEQLIVYDIAKYRWCENVQRFHKSNNIMWVFVVVYSQNAFFYCSLIIVMTIVWLTLLGLISVGSLWTWKRKFGTRSVTTLSARTSDPPVRGNPRSFTSLEPCALTHTWVLQVTRCLRRSASATSWRWSVIPTPPSCVHFPVNPQRLLCSWDDRMMKIRRT